jgi:hypothetical protein
MGTVLALAMLCSAAITKIGGQLVDAQRAQHAANTAALAAIYDEALADDLASRNGGELLEIEDHREIDGTVNTLARVGGATRSATAFDTWRDTTPTLEP